MEPNKMISLTFKFAGFWTKVKNEERMKYENGKQRTIKIKLGLINFVQIEQQFKALCPWIEGHDTQLFYHVPRSSPKVYKCLENEDDTIQMIEQIQDIGRVEIVVDTNDTNEVAVHVQNGGGSGDINLHMVDITSAMTSSTSQQAAPIQHEDDLTLLVGARFTTASDFKLALRSHAIKKNFDVKIKASDKKRVIATCAYRGCPWRIRASLCSYSDTFEIRRINVTHICPGINRSGNKQATISWIANEIQGLVKDHPHIPLKQINKNLETTYGLSLPYMKLWRSREIAREIAFRLVDESYSWVPTLKAELLRRNPGSHILYTFDQNDNSTLRFFVSFRVSIEGFLYGCRPLIGVGACYLKSKYLGVLLSANALDGNNDLFTLAFAVVETESKGTWTWFLEQIYQAIGFDLFPLAFISDMEKGIYEAIKEVFPFAEHRVCVRQLWKNLKKYFHHSDGRNTQDLVWAAANAITTLQFDIKMNELSSLFPTIHSYLHKLPYKWSKSQFCNEIKNDRNTNNLSESFNSWIEDARDKPVVDLIDIIRGMLMEQRALRKINGYNWTQDLVPHVEEYIRNITTKREHFIIRQSTVSVFEIEGVTGRYEVDIDARSCSCQVWELTGLPCIHAATFIAMKEHTLWHTYIDNYYHVLRYRLAYEGAISTLPSRDQWQYIDETKAYFLDETKDAIKNITSDCGQMEHEFHTKVEALSGVGQMDSKAQRKALFRSRLKETSQKREKHIDSPLVRYNEDDQPVCRVCNVALKSESLWPAHQASRKHHEAIENIKAAASRQSTSGNSHPERQQNLPEPQAASTLPANFFDSQDTKKQKTVHVKKSSGSGSSYSLVSKEVDQSKTNGRSVQSSKQIGSNDVIQVKAALSEGFSDKGATEEHNSSKKSQISWDDKNLEVKEERGFLPSGFFDRIDSNGVGHSQQLSQQSEKPDIVQLNQVKGPLPEGFFDNKDEDLRARGIEPIRVDIADAYKEFEREIQEDLQEVDDRLEEEEIDAADVREGIESIEHKAYRDRVEIVKKKLIQAKESRLARMHQSPKFRGKNSSDDSSSEDDVYEDFSVDWRAKRF